MTDAWVAEVWIDPDWYADQESTDPLPSAGVPTVVLLKTTSVLVGRTSRSRGIHPDIDLGTDNGISRRHCQLTTDGSRWWVEDLGSSNGTYLGSAVGPLPTDPVPVGEKREIAPDARVYLGAWTRIVVRRAQPGEA
ncbi:FHA domain-containing protein [Nocardioides sp. LHD-245]|nr:FHA domain-containing protein [Nocardioides sp. LHD-245]